MNGPAGPGSGRIEALDGLRGLAAVAVANFHFLSAYVPAMMPDQTIAPWRGSDTPLALFYNGSFAVSVFFVLSGFVIAGSARRRRSPLPLAVVARYVRLAVPVLGGTLFAWALLRAAPQAVATLKALDPHAWLETTYDGDVPGFAAAVCSALFDVFRDGASRYDNVLWTMRTELLGSCLIYLVYALPLGAARPATTTALALLAVWPLGVPDYAAFLLGALLCDARRDGRLPAALSGPALVVGLLLGAMMGRFGERVFGWHAPRLLALGQAGQLWLTLAAAALVYGVLTAPRLQAWLASGPCRYLGRISFGLYLVHVPLLFTVLVPLRLRFGPSPLGLAALYACFAAASLLAGTLFTSLVDRPALAVAGALGRMGRAPRGPAVAADADRPGEAHRTSP